AGGGVAGDCAAARRGRRPNLIPEAAAVADDGGGGGAGGVAGEAAVADGRCPEVVDAAAVAVAGVAPGDRQARDGHRLAGLDREDAGKVATADGQLVGPGAVDLDGVGDVEFTAGQGDRAGEPVVEDDGVGAGGGGGPGAGGAERAGTPVGQGGDLESRWDDALSQRLRVRQEALP